MNEHQRWSLQEVQDMANAAVVLDEQNQTLAALVLPWAREQHKAKYDQTLLVASQPEVFRRYLVRLLELRWEQDGDIEADWKKNVPFWALEETNVVVHATAFGQPIEICGRKVLNRTWAWAEMAMVMTEPDKEKRKELVRELAALKLGLDLKVVGIDEQRS
jgi:hypothetical protein